MITGGLDFKNRLKCIKQLHVKKGQCVGASASVALQMANN